MTMRSTLVLSTLAVAASASNFASAGDATVFEPWLGPDTPGCVTVSNLKDVAKVVELTPAQFDFVRGLYVAIPPISHKLPAGDRAILAMAGGETAVFLVDGDVTCARMLISNFIRDELMGVGRGDVTHAGDPS